MKIKYTITCILMVLSTSIHAATLTNASVTPDDLSFSATTNYTIKFDAATSFGVDNNIRVTTADTFRFRNPMNGLVSVIQPANLTMGTFYGGVDARTLVVAPSNVVTNGTTVEFVLTVVTNPPDNGSSFDYIITVEDSMGIPFDSVTVPALVYTGAGGPTVTNMIPNQTINADDGQITVDLDAGVSVNNDLNYTFTDDNGETLSFSIAAGHNASIVTPVIVGDTLRLTGLQTGSTTVTVQADDTSGGVITESFDVNVIGTLTPAIITPTSLVAGDTTDYTIQFFPATALSPGDRIILDTTDLNQGLSTLDSLSGGSLSGSKISGNANQTIIEITAGSATIANQITVVLGSIVNPGVAGMGNAYTLRTTSGAVVQSGLSTISGSTYTAANTPTVVNIIPNQNVKEEDGAVTVDLDAGAPIVTDLNFIFDDGDGDPMTFTIDSIGNTNVVTASVMNDMLIITGVGSGLTTVTVKADDLQDGFITTSFQVTVLGTLSAVITPTSLFTNSMTEYTVVLTPAAALSTGSRIALTTSGGIDQVASSLVSIVGGSALTAAKTGGDVNQTILTVNGGSASTMDTLTIVLSGIANPENPGLGADYILTTDNGGPSFNGFSTVSGSVFVDAPEDIFADGFEETVFILAAKNTVDLINSKTPANETVSELTRDSNNYLFMGNTLTLFNSNAAFRSLNSVVAWFETILREGNPTGDFDQDSISNEFDIDPFGLILKN